VVEEVGLDGAGHLQLDEAVDEGAKMLPRGMLVNIESLADGAGKVVERNLFFALDLLPDSRARAIQAVINERVQIQQHARFVFEEIEHSGWGFLYLHQTKNKLSALFAQEQGATGLKPTRPASPVENLNHSRNDAGALEWEPFDSAPLIEGSEHLFD